MPWYRTRLGKDDAIIQIRKRVWWTLWLATRSEDYSTLLSAVNKIDLELIELKEKMEKKLSSRMALAEFASNSYKRVEEMKYDKFDISEWEFLDEKGFKDLVAPYTPRPDLQIVTQFLNPKVIQKYKLNQSISYRNEQKGSAQQNQRRAGGHLSGTPLVPGQSGITAYTFNEFADKAIHIAEDSGVDQVVAFKENQNRNNQGNKEGLNKLKQKHPFNQNRETKAEWEARLREMLKDDQDS